MNKNFQKGVFYFIICSIFLFNLIAIDSGNATYYSSTELQEKVNDILHSWQPIKEEPKSQVKSRKSELDKVLSSIHRLEYLGTPLNIMQKEMNNLKKIHSYYQGMFGIQVSPIQLDHFYQSHCLQSIAEDSWCRVANTTLSPKTNEPEPTPSFVPQKRESVPLSQPFTEPTPSFVPQKRESASLAQPFTEQTPIDPLKMNKQPPETAAPVNYDMNTLKPPAASKKQSFQLPEPEPVDPRTLKPRNQPDRSSNITSPPQEPETEPANPRPIKPNPSPSLPSTNQIRKPVEPTPSKKYISPYATQTIQNKKEKYKPIKKQTLKEKISAFKQLVFSYIKRNRIKRADLVSLFPNHPFPKSIFLSRDIVHLVKTLNKQIIKEKQYNYNYELYHIFGQFRKADNRYDDYLENICLAYIYADICGKIKILKEINSLKIKSAKNGFSVSSASLNALTNAGLLQRWNEDTLLFGIDVCYCP